MALYWNFFSPNRNSSDEDTPTDFENVKTTSRILLARIMTYALLLLEKLLTMTMYICPCWFPKIRVPLWTSRY